MVLPAIAKIPNSARGGRKSPKATNNNIHRLHEFFTKIVKASGDQADLTLRKVAKRLSMSRRNRPAVKLSAVVEEIGDSGNVAMVVAKVLDDERMLVVPAVKIVALQWSRSVQEKIEGAGGSIHTLDQFIRVAGSLEKIQLIKGDPNARKSSKFFGPAPGERHSKAYPRQTNKGKNKEKRLKVQKPVSYDSDSE